ncbi:MAG: leucine-rich repeat domain-containing protein [Parvularcula sp.]|jgi:hypothetical protein|nr:leucine-rich repeat domain-containing protein [Parvularcula sp.]
MSELNQLFAMRIPVVEESENERRDATVDIFTEDERLDARHLRIRRIRFEDKPDVKVIALPEVGLRKCGPVEHLNRLRELDLAGNELKRLPRIFGLKHLRKIDVSGNQLDAADIDRMLQELAASVDDSGQLDYSDNPGSDDSQRGVAARNARFVLERLGWNIKPDRAHEPEPEPPSENEPV